MFGEDTETLLLSKNIIMFCVLQIKFPIKQIQVFLSVFNDAEYHFVFMSPGFCL